MGRLKLFNWLARILLALQMLWLPQAVLAAAYATGGSGKYKNEILWLTWGNPANPFGKNGVRLDVGASTSASLAVAQGVNLDVSCKITSISGGSLTSYTPGGWKGSGGNQGDRLDVLYNIGGEGGKNQLVSGIVSENAKNIDFGVECNSKVGGKDLNLRGFVIADAESMTANENIRSSAEGQWYLIDSLTNPAAGEYRITRSNALTGNNSIQIDTPSSNSGNGGRTAVTFLKFSQPKPIQKMSFGVKGQGKTAIAIGLVVPFADFGDAPQSYGDAMHLIDDINFSNDGVGTSGAAVNINVAGFKLADFLAPAQKYLGSSGPDSEPNSTYSDGALGDDSSGLLAASGKEEDAWPVQYKTLSVLKAGATLANIPVACRGNGEVSAWIDMNVNGRFDSDEKATAICSGGQALLNWTLPKDLKAGKTYVRLRYSDLTRNMDATGIAEDGEVEDHQIIIESPKLNIVKRASASQWVIGQSDASYTC